MSEHPYGWLSLLPPLVAIVLAIVTRRVVTSMLAGVLFGALVLCKFNPICAIEQMCSEHLLAKLFSPDTLHIVLFTSLMGAMVGLINRAAGMRGLVNVVTPLASNRRRGQLATWLLGLFVFFDDYANTLLLGNTLKPLTDKLKISREKLAYLVDSTSAPVAGLFVISTWIASELAFVQEGLEKLPGDLHWNAFNVFVESIPYRFYVLWTLLFVPLVAIFARDFGPMLKAERRCLAVDDASYENPDDLEIVDPTAPNKQTPARWCNAVIPILITVFAVIWFLYQSGNPENGKSLINTFGDADAYSSLLWGALAGLVAAFVLIWPQRILGSNEMLIAAGNGAFLMLPALVILWLAQTLSTMTGNETTDKRPLEIATLLKASGASNEQIGKDLNNYPIDAVVQALAGADYAVYRRKLDELAADSVINDELKRQQRRTQEEQLWIQFKHDSAKTEEYSKSTDALRENLFAAGYSNEAIDYALAYTTVESVRFDRKFETGEVADGTEADADRADNVVTRQFVVVAFAQRSSRLSTGVFLSKQLQRLRDGDNFLSQRFVQLLPTFVFLLASVIAFSTGTSWGTMGIVMPLVIPLAYSQIALDGATVAANNPILLCCVGSVLAGAIFGDHCSPISDTTVLSSQASGCNHIAHVQTQLPYALLVASVSALFGTLPIGFGVSVWIMLPIGVGVMLAFLLIFGKRTSLAE